MIALAPRVGYIHEPFHVEHSPGLCSARFEQWFTYISHENERPYEETLRRTLGFEYDLRRGLGAARNLSDLRRALTDWRLSRRYRRIGARPLLKDPLALLSAEWLASRFAAQVLVLIRHPAAFAASLRRLNWNFSFQHFLDQPLLMRDHLEEYRDAITQQARKVSPILEQAALLWRILYGVVRKYQLAHPEWIFIRHEDVAREPIASFRSLYARLGLDLSGEIESRIVLHSGGEDDEADRDDPHLIRRDSQAAIASWKSQLAPAEIDAIRAAVGDISTYYYSPSDW